MRSIMDILLDDSDASIALSLCIAGDVARSTDATSESSGELTTASTRLPTRGSKSFAQGTAGAGGVARHWQAATTPTVRADRTRPNAFQPSGDD